MTDTTQPMALRLADWLQAAVQIFPQRSEDDPGGYASEVDQIMDEAAAELRSLHAELETLRAGYAAARLEIESLRGKGWQPIETAPKDGTFLLLWEQYSTNPFIGSWLGTRWTVSHEHVDAEGGWDGANVVDALSMPVTHWMPLPAAPGPADGESNG